MIVPRGVLSYFRDFPMWPQMLLQFHLTSVRNVERDTQLLFYHVQYIFCIFTAMTQNMTSVLMCSESFSSFPPETCVTYFREIISKNEAFDYNNNTNDNNKSASTNLDKLMQDNGKNRADKKKNDSSKLKDIFYKNALKKGVVRWLCLIHSE